MCISLNLEPEKRLIFSELGPLQALQIEAGTFHFELASLSVKGTILCLTYINTSTSQGYCTDCVRDTLLELLIGNDRHSLNSNLRGKNKEALIGSRCN